MNINCNMCENIGYYVKYPNSPVLKPVRRSVYGFYPSLCKTIAYLYYLKPMQYTIWECDDICPLCERNIPCEYEVNFGMLRGEYVCLDCYTGYYDYKQTINEV